MKYYIKRHNNSLYITCRSSNAPYKNTCIGSASCTEDCDCCLDYNSTINEFWIKCSDIINAMPLEELQELRKNKLNKLREFI